MGPEVAELEAQLSAHCGAQHSIACSFGGPMRWPWCLMASEVRPGQAIFCPAFTFVATAEVVAWLGAHVWFVDVDADTFNMDPASLEIAIAAARAAGARAGGRDPGRPLRHPRRLRRDFQDCRARRPVDPGATARSPYGARYHNRRVGTLAMATATSFFPAKPLGAYGDGGAIFTDDAELAEILRSILFHGKGTSQYDNVRIGMTGRIDTMQGSDPDREAGDLRRRDRGPQPDRRALFGPAQGPCGDTSRARRAAVRLGAIHRQAAGWRRPRRNPGEDEGSRRAERGLFTPSRCIARTPTATTASPAAPCPSPTCCPTACSACRMHPYLDEATQDRGDGCADRGAVGASGSREFPARNCMRPGRFLSWTD